MRKLLTLSALLLFSVDVFAEEFIYKIIAVENLNDPLEEEIIISSEMWDQTPSKLKISYEEGEYDVFLQTKFNKNDLSSSTMLMIKAIHRQTPTFWLIKFLNTEGKPTTKSVYSGGAVPENQYDKINCTLSYRMPGKYVLNPPLQRATRCYRETSFSYPFDDQQMNYFLDNGFKVKLSGVTDLTINLDAEEVMELISKTKNIQFRYTDEGAKDLQSIRKIESFLLGKGFSMDINGDGAIGLPNGQTITELTPDEDIRVEETIKRFKTRCSVFLEADEKYFKRARCPEFLEIF